MFCTLVHSYVNYANFTLTSTNRTYQKIILGKQKQVVQQMSSDDIYIWLRLLMKEFNILNV